MSEDDVKRKGGEWLKKFEADQRVYYQNIGEVIVSWNACEERLRDMVIWLAGGRTPANVALTAHMSGKALVETLPTLTTDLDPDVRHRFEHYARAVDMLREHRNYYAHGIELVGIGPLDEPNPLEAQAYVKQTTSRNQLKFYYEKVELKDLVKLKTVLMSYQAFGFNLLARAFPGFRNLGARQPNSPWPDTPPLPDRLKKRPPILLGALHPPKSSPD